MREKVKRVNSITHEKDKQTIANRIEVLEDKLEKALLRISQLEKMKIPYMESQIGTFRVAK